MEHQLVSLKDMAKQLSVHPTTLRSWAKAGEIPYHRIGKKYFFVSKEVNESSKSDNIEHSSDHRVMVSNGYLYLYIGKHPMANKNGYVAAHRLIMQAKLGRPLNKNEIVHMKNGNTLDLRIDNLELHESLGRHNSMINFKKNDRRT